jgi:hypothetical protein
VDVCSRAKRLPIFPSWLDHTLKFKQSKKKESFMPMPDYMIESAALATSGPTVTSINAASQQRFGGLETPAGLLSGTATGANVLI